VVHLAARAVDVLEGMRRTGIEPKRLRMVHSYAGAEAAIVLVEGVKGGGTGLTVERPLILYSSAKNYTAEAAALIAGQEEGKP
jgi:tRNA1Val (adenine37-N6)-methyltransferase